MTVSQPRTRLVYFRLSEEEFQQIQQLCQAIAARSVSELVRTAVQRFLAEHAQDERRNTRQKLDGITTKLHDAVAQLRQVISSIHGEQTDGVADLQGQAVTTMLSARELSAGTGGDIVAKTKKGRS